MKWSNEPPTEKGWYWRRKNSWTVAKKLDFIGDALFAEIDGYCARIRPEKGVEWWTTPITEPIEQGGGE